MVEGLGPTLVRSMLGAIVVAVDEHVAAPDLVSEGGHTWHRNKNDTL